MTETMTKTKRTVADYPQLVSEWHPTKNMKLTPADCPHKSHKKVWWVCNKGHEWEANINNRNSKNRNGCPYCSNRKVCVANSLASTHKKLVNEEWHWEKNQNIKPHQVLSGSDIIVWWLCKEGHEWQSRIANRTVHQSGCPICNCASPSENKIHKIMCNFNVLHKREYKDKRCKHKNILRFDFAIFGPIDNMSPIGIIEYQGEQHFNQGWNKRTEQQKRDQIKRDFCAKYKIPLLEIADESQIENQVTNFLIQLGLIN